MLLPAPFSPISPRISPAETARSTSLFATTGPNRFEMPLSSSSVRPGYFDGMGLIFTAPLFAFATSGFSLATIALGISPRVGASPKTPSSKPLT